MENDAYKRKISAILSADVVGYSSLMEDDESATVSTLEAYRATIATITEQHRGRVIDSPGDNILSEFSSVVEAVQCGVEMQQAMKAKNADLPDARKMEFRIGINLGDVIEEGKRIYGDGVNIAARIEALADPGGICISGSAYEQIASKLALGYESMGDHKLKNIARPIHIYRIPTDPEAAIKAEKKRGLFPGLVVERAPRHDDASANGSGSQQSKDIEGYYIGGFVCLAVAVGLPLLGYFVGRGDPEPLFAMTGIGILVGGIGIALILAARWLDRRRRATRNEKRQ